MEHPFIDYPTIAAATRARGVFGWLAPSEAHALHALAAAAAGPILEIGTYCGLSTCFLAAPGRQPVYAVDPHSARHHNPTQHQVFARVDTRAIAEGHWAALGLSERITVVQATSKAAAARKGLPRSFGLVFVDGDHAKAAEDIERWAPRVAPGGWLALHDWRERGDEAEPWDVEGAWNAYSAAHPGVWDEGSLTSHLAVFRRLPEGD